MTKSKWVKVALLSSRLQREIIFTKILENHLSCGDLVMQQCVQRQRNQEEFHVQLNSNTGEEAQFSQARAGRAGSPRLGPTASSVQLG